MWVKSVFALLLACAGAFLAVGCQDGEVSLEQSLAYACLNGNFDSVVDLLERGADANGGEDETGAPLTYALYEGNFTIADILIDNGADVNLRFDDGKSLLDMIINMEIEADDEAEKAKLQLAIDWLYENGARRRP
ncbi:MAG: ankyrin repeat domain-containing protein [Armatimonadetes bacterium]|nr:ankyrin repeat domain-containing protein [Armatimonadota bacterium]